jgi:hypothetical protein
VLTNGAGCGILWGRIEKAPHTIVIAAAAIAPQSGRMLEGPRADGPDKGKGGGQWIRVKS